MKILMINKFLYPNGGSETYIFKLGECLVSKGHEVQYFGLENEKCPLCGSNLITTTHAEYRGEYCGSDCYEEMVVLECEDSHCNFTHK